MSRIVELLKRDKTRQWVITKLSCPLMASCFPSAPAILPSRDWAKVRVTKGRVGGGSVARYGARRELKYSGTVVMSRLNRFNEMLSQIDGICQAQNGNTLKLFENRRRRKICVK
jgi:hypothetical protein